jgi:hypothetical protein
MRRLEVSRGTYVPSEKGVTVERAKQPLVSQREAADLLGLSGRTLEAMRRLARGPGLQPPSREGPEPYNSAIYARKHLDPVRDALEKTLRRCSETVDLAKGGVCV